MTLPDEGSESDTERDGFLSYAAEWHAFSLGFYDGMKSWRARPSDLPDNPDAEAEPHYYKGAYVLGTLVQLLVVVVTGSALGVF